MLAVQLQCRRGSATGRAPNGCGRRARGCLSRACTAAGYMAGRIVMEMGRKISGGVFLGAERPGWTALGADLSRPVGSRRAPAAGISCSFRRCRGGTPGGELHEL